MIFFLVTIRGLIRNLLKYAFNSFLFFGTRKQTFLTELLNFRILNLDSDEKRLHHRRENLGV